MSAACSKPLSSDLSPEVFAWASELRALFAATGLSINRFVSLHPQIDKGTVSRYLNGRRVPRDRWFLDTLLAFQESGGRPLTSEACEYLAELQLSALETAHPHEYRVRRVSDELKSAVEALREAEHRSQSIEEQLDERIRRVQELTVDKQRLRDAWARDRAHMWAERRRLTKEIADLTEKLRQAREQGVQAEQRCRRLEEFLDHLKTRYPSHEGLGDHHVYGESRTFFPADEDMVDTTARVLALAQETADLAISGAQREAAEILRQAKIKAAEIVAHGETTLDIDATVSALTRQVAHDSPGYPRTS